MMRSVAATGPDPRSIDDPPHTALDHTYGLAALTLGAFLCWYAIWTIECTALVLLHFHYSVLLWAPVPPTILTALAVWRLAPTLIRNYGQGQVDQLQLGTAPFAGSDWLRIAAIFLLAAFAAVVGNRFPYAAPLCIASVISSVLLWTIGRRRSAQTAPLADPSSALRLAVLTILLLLLYYFAHRYDADDANYTNLAIGARRTAGAIYQFDTMIGDGPNPLHLPTYKFHSYELLAAVLSSYTGLSAIAVLHLLLPGVMLPLTAMVLLVVLKPLAGRHWFAAALFVVALLFWNDDTLGSWGVHGIIRFQQGKGFLVTAVMPLIAAITVRWFVKREPVDLVALALANVCAIGFSANGLYGGPAASGLVAIAFLASEWRSRAMWRRVVALLPVLAWPVLVALLIVVLHLALPSEITTQSPPISQLNFVTGYHTEGRLLIALMLLSPLAFIDTRLAMPALIYIPCALILILNPLGYAALSAITGNLAFRIFWSMPVMVMIALLTVKLLGSIGLRSEGASVTLGCAALAVAIATVAIVDRSETRIAWHAPALKVDRDDWSMAERLAGATQSGCTILAPERYSALLTQMERAPYPVFARELYLTHYRFTMPPAELRLRDRLRLVVDGDGTGSVPTRAEVLAQRLPIGTIAVAAGSDAAPGAATLARDLGLSGPDRESGLLIWSGRCKASLP